MDPAASGSRTATALRVAAYLAIAYLAALLLDDLVQVLLLVFAGLLGATFLDATATWVGKRARIPRKVALAIVCVFLVGTSVGFWVAVGPALVREIEELGTTLPVALDRLAVTFGEEGWGASLMQQTDKVGDVIQSQTAMRGATTAARSLFGGFGALVFVGFIALFVAVEPGQYRRGLLRLLPVPWRPRAGEVLAASVASLQRWLLSTMFSMLVVGALTFAGLSLLGVPLAFALSVVAALMTFIPNIGPVIAAVPAVLLGFLGSTQTALLVAALYLGVQILETYLITPLLQRRLLSLPPALVLVAQALMGVLGGLVGVIVATPLTLISIVLVQRVYVEGRLERAPAVTA